ncbi:MAG: ureidoglycolate lyase [Myxococcota bacterium]|nr:ureidoglycolate lyase [Myxococcota bacterium]
MILPIQRISRELYSPYGDLIAGKDGSGGGEVANQGTAEAFHNLASFKNLRPDSASPSISVFRVQPLSQTNLRLKLLEKHPYSTQFFIPMNAVAYLAIVALGDEHPEVDTLKVFKVPGNQAIGYHPGVWHYPMVALERVTDFVTMTYQIGNSEDCVIQEFNKDMELEISM